MTLPLVLLPGMMCDARLFASQIAALSAGRTVVCAEISGATDMTGIAHQVLADAPPSFALAGLSMGGIVAMEILRIAPSRVARLGLLDTNPLAEDQAVKDGRGPQMEQAKAGNLDRLMTTTFIPRYLHQPDATIIDTCIDMALALGPDVFCRQSFALRDRPDHTETLRQSDVPTMILHGEHDQLCPPARHDLMQQLMPHATRIVIKDAGHLPTLEQPEPTTQALRSWLD